MKYLDLDFILALLMFILGALFIYEQVLEKSWFNVAGMLIVMCGLILYQCIEIKSLGRIKHE